MVDVLTPLGATAAITTSTTPVAGKINRYNASAGALTQALPALSGLAPGARYVVQKDELDITSKTVTFTCAGSDTFDSGATSIVLRVPGSTRSFNVVTVGSTKYWKVGGDSHDPLSSLDSRFAGARAGKPAGLLFGLPSIAERNNSFATNSFSNGTNTDHYSRIGHYVMTSANDVRLVFGNYAYGARGQNDITVDATVEPPANAITAASSVTSQSAVTFNGRPTVTISPDGFAVSDPIPISVTAGQYLYVRTHVSATGGGKWPLGMITSPTLSQQEGAVSATSPTPGYMALSSPTAIGQSNTSCYSAMAVLGAPATINGTITTARSVLGLGDSIIAGIGQSTDSSGFFRRACRAAGVGYIELGTPSQTSQGILPPLTAPRGQFLSSPFDLVICEYGSNDCAITSVTLGTVQTNLIAAWLLLARRGHRVLQTTITPRATSTDGFVTTTNQTALTPYSTLKTQLNGWIRAGAPVTAGFAPAAIGAGTYVIGNPQHPLAGYFDLADIAESARDSNVWAPATGRAITVTASANGFSITSSDAAFTSADIGQTVYVPGAGPSGAGLYVEIVNVSSATQASVWGIVSTAVSNVAGRIGVTTPDGIHPSSTMHGLIAAALAPALQAAVA